MECYDVSVIGLGYIGLPTAALLASKGKNVVGVDVNEDVVDTINGGNIHIVEPGLQNLVKNVVKEGHLQASLVPKAADVHIVAVPTPFSSSSHGAPNPVPDLSYVKAAALSLATVLKVGDLVILESTSPVGTTEKLSSWFAEARPDLTFPHSHDKNSDIRIAFCPERVLPGNVLEELVTNDRLIGGMTNQCCFAAIGLYREFVVGACISTNARTAEMTKLTENAFRDVNIAFANELSMLCESLDIDVWELIALANKHPRVNILRPSSGVGGHCIAVDPWFIVSERPELARLVKTARIVNDSKPFWVIERITNEARKYLQTTSENRVTIACLGLAFKPNIDDLRESPAVEVVKKLTHELEIEVLIVEPNISDIPKTLGIESSLCDLETGLLRADIVVVLTNHDEFHDVKSRCSSSQVLLNFVSAL